MNKLVPFSGPSGTDLGDLHVETDEDSLVLSGSVEIRRDKEGLRRIRTLLQILGDAEASLSGSGDLPEQSPEPQPASGPKVRNPFE